MRGHIHKLSTASERARARARARQEPAMEELVSVRGSGWGPLGESGGARPQTPRAGTDKKKKNMGFGWNIGPV